MTVEEWCEHGDRQPVPDEDKKAPAKRPKWRRLIERLPDPRRAVPVPNRPVPAL